ncbi:hypothetical protein BDY19DRAFT_902918 [Irpex rosettiformis]|uniref:Uncharacterized protein n=1 Tax=Irpex rosettiformis TaxID=378272 RepID=A0ACB8UFJ9_9APHY|nr:hypothetical protein BDY19DRAFT_902918 [Irpex rosettiformis]
MSRPQRVTVLQARRVDFTGKRTDADGTLGPDLSQEKSEIDWFVVIFPQVHASYRQSRTRRQRDLRAKARQPYLRPDPNLLTAAPHEIIPHSIPSQISLPTPAILTTPYPDLSSFPTPFDGPSSAAQYNIDLDLDEDAMSALADLRLSSPLPRLPEGIHSGDMLMACVDHYQAYNSAMGSIASKLTSTVAHSPPSLSSEDRQLIRAYQRGLERAEREEGTVSELNSNTFPASDGDTFLPPLPDLDAVQVQNADEDDEETEEIPIMESQIDALPLNEPSVSAADEDVPNPFSTNTPLQSPSNLTSMSPHLLCIYAIVAWLHLQFHLSRVACNVILWSFALVISVVSPTIALPFVTLKSANHALGLDDLPITILPVCPQCKEVYPASDATPELCIKCSVSLFKPNSTPRGTRRANRVPILKYPTMSIAHQLEMMLAAPGMEESLDSWRTKSRQPGVYQDIFDGAVTKNLLGPDGRPFFINSGPEHAKGPNGELRLGASWGADCILPGPSEQSGDELQRFIRPIINELIQLWREGVWIKTPSSPQGNTEFKATSKAFEVNAFPERTNAEHRRRGEEYLKLKTDYARKMYVKAYATRFTQLSRLPYFDIVRQVVVDPMHNLFLGLVKTHFYHIWVQMKILREKHELKVFHDLLRDFSLPTSAGKLPKDIGIPAGGSLTADQWKLLAIFHGPVIIPQLWRRCMPEDIEASRQNRLKRIEREEMKKVAAKKERAAKAAQKKNKKLQSEQTTDKSTGHDSSPSASTPDDPCNLHPDDPANFLKLSEALRILSQYVLTESDVNMADTLLRSYCSELIKVDAHYCIRPNHHYAMHTSQFVRDFGPLHEFWSFLFERLNKVLKAYNTNNHGTGGELETTFFTEFHRTCASARLTYLMQSMPETSIAQRLSTVMLNATQEERGTVASLAVWMKELEQEQIEVEPVEQYELSKRQKTADLDSDAYAALLHYFQVQNPTWHLHSRFQRPQFSDSMPLTRTVIFFDYVSLKGQRFYAENLSGNRSASIVSANVSWSTTPACGTLLDIFQFQQRADIPAIWLARVRWFKKWQGPSEDVWKMYQRLDVRLWQLKEYLGPQEASEIIEVTQLHSLLGMQTVTVGDLDAKVWATVSHDHVRYFN